MCEVQSQQNCKSKLRNTVGITVKPLNNVTFETGMVHQKLSGFQGNFAHLSTKLELLRKNEF